MSVLHLCAMSPHVVPTKAHLSSPSPLRGGWRAESEANSVSGGGIIPYAIFHPHPGLRSARPTLPARGRELSCIVQDIRFNFQTACACGACPIRANERRASSLSRIITRVAFVSPLTTRGAGAPQGAPCVCFASGIACEAMMCPGSASPCGAPLRRFWARGPYFRVRTGELIIPDPDCFRRFHPHRVQPRTAEPHSWPGR